MKLHDGECFAKRFAVWHGEKRAKFLKLYPSTVLPSFRSQGWEDFEKWLLEGA